MTVKTSILFDEWAEEEREQNLAAQSYEEWLASHPVRCGCFAVCMLEGQEPALRQRCTWLHGGKRYAD